MMINHDNEYIIMIINLVHMINHDDKNHDKSIFFLIVSDKLRSATGPVGDFGYLQALRLMTVGQMTGEGHSMKIPGCVQK